MSDFPASVKLTGKQLMFLMKVTGKKDPDSAIEVFVKLMIEERIEVSKLPLYVTKMMEREKK